MLNVLDAPVGPIFAESMAWLMCAFCFLPRVHRELPMSTQTAILRFVNLGSKRGEEIMERSFPRAYIGPDLDESVRILIRSKSLWGRATS